MRVARPPRRLTVLLLSLCPVWALALADAVLFDIPAQPLPDALQAFAKQAKMQILYRQDAVRNSTSNPVVGDFEAHAALELLIEGTGLEIVYSDENAATVRPVQTSATAPPARPSGTIRLAQAGTASASDTGRANSADSGLLEEIVVTAEKRSQSVQSVAASVTALAGEDLVTMGSTNLVQVARHVPSLQISPLRTQTLIFLRGVGQTLTSPNADPGVAVNLNGVYVPSEMTATSFYDLERVEVLPGPQGTLYGRNATGGVVNLITRRPGSEFGAETFLEVGNYDRVQAFAALDVPVADALAVRTAFNVIRRDGYYSNGTDDQDSVAGRMTGVWQAGERTIVSAVASFSHDAGLGNVNQNVPPSGDYRDLDFDPRALGFNTDFETRQASLQIDHELSEPLTFTYLGGYNRLEAFQRTTMWAGPPTSPIINDYGVEANSHELRLNGAWTGLEGILGAYYFRGSSDYMADATPLPGVRAVNGPFEARTESEAVFGQATYSVLDPLRLTGGLRYSRTVKELEGQNTNFIGAAPPAVVIYSGDDTDSRLDWKAGFEFDIAARSMLYGNVATGFNPGGFSTATVARNSTQAAAFEPVELTAYTVGVKNRFLGNRITLNLEGFYYDYENYQVSARNALTAQNQVFNAEKAEIKGAQLDSQFALTDSDQLMLNVAYLQAEAVTLITPAGNFSGFELPYSPKWTVNASYRHTFHLDGGARVEALASYNHATDRWGFYTHAPGTYINGRSRTDVDITYRSRDDKWSASIWGRNLEDHVILTTGISGAIPGPAAFGLEPPRTYGVRFGANFY